MTWYEVLSPELRRDYGGYEPPEYGCCYVVVEANNRLEAKKLALRHPDMKDWVRTARSDGFNPLYKLKVNKALCHHGVCFITDDCSQCKEQWELEELNFNIASDEGADVFSN